MSGPCHIGEALVPRTTRPPPHCNPLAAHGQRQHVPLPFISILRRTHVTAPVPSCTRCGIQILTQKFNCGTTLRIPVPHPRLALSPLHHT
jgi:hypothetical protein